MRLCGIHVSDSLYPYRLQQLHLSVDPREQQTMYSTPVVSHRRTGKITLTRRVADPINQSINESFVYRNVLQPLSSLHTVLIGEVLTVIYLLKPRNNKARPPKTKQRNKKYTNDKKRDDTKQRKIRRDVSIEAIYLFGGGRTRRTRRRRRRS